MKPHTHSHMQVLFKCSQNLAITRSTTMPDCHKCKLNGHPNRRCLKYKGPSMNPTNHGQRIVSLDHMPPKELARFKVPIPEPEHPMAEFMHTWLRLPPRTRDMVSHVLVEGAPSWSSIARKLKVSRQDVSQNLLKAARQYPELRTVLRLRSRSLRCGKAGSI
jgi:hypothetical protein